MTFGLDFDDTFTAAPDLWRQFIALARLLGHRVVIVTARHDTIENRQDIDQALEPLAARVYCTSLGPKIWHMEQQGVQVDVWIDDNPAAVVHGH